MSRAVAKPPMYIFMTTFFFVAFIHEPFPHPSIRRDTSVRDPHLTALDGTLPAVRVVSVPQL